MPRKGRFAEPVKGKKAPRAGGAGAFFGSGLFRRGEATAPPKRMTGGAAPSPPEGFPESQGLARLPAGRTGVAEGNA